MANLRTVGHELQVLRLDVLTAKLEAVLENHVLTHVVTGGTSLDAVAQIVAVNIGVGVSCMHTHESTPLRLHRYGRTNQSRC
jgi:hypothetical protein